MPFANLKVPAGLIGEAEKSSLVEGVTDLYVHLFGERARATTMVLVEEVADGGWGIGGNVLTAAMLSAAQPKVAQLVVGQQGPDHEPDAPRHLDR